MKHVSVLATALGLGTLWLLPACGDSTAEETTPEVPAEAEATTQTTVHYTCAAGCGTEKDAPLADGVPECCESPMVATP